MSLRRHFSMLLAPCLVGSLVAGPSAAASEDLGQLSLEALLELPVVTASRVPEKLAEAPATVLVFEREELRARGYRDLSELLDDLEGMDVVRPRGATWFKSYWRGFRNTIGSPWLLLRDGVVLNHLYFNTADVLAALPLTDVERVEVVVGPASSLYGANAFMGVLHVLTASGKTQATRSRVEIGENHTEVADVYLRDVVGEWTWSVALRTENGELDTSAVDALPSADPTLLTDARLWGDAALGGRLGGTASSPVRHRAADVRLRRSTAGDGELEMGAWFFKTSSGYGFEYAWDQAQPRAVWARSDVSTHLRWARDLTERVRSTTLLRYRTSGVDDDSYFIEAYEDDEGERLIDFSIWRAQNESWTLTQDFELDWRDDVALWAGVEVEHRNLQKAYETAFSEGRSPLDFRLDEILLPEPGDQTGPANNRERTWDVGTYVQGRWTLRPGRWLHLGLRWDDHSEYGDDLTVRAAHVGREGPWTWKALYGESFQEPNPRVLYGGWAGSGSDPDLRPERSRTLETSLARTAGRGEARLSVWWVENRDTIVNTGPILVDSPDGPVQIDPGARNLGDRRVQGADLHLHTRPRKDLDVSLTWSHLFDAEEEVFDERGDSAGDAGIGDLAMDKVLAGATWKRAAWSLDLRGRWIGSRKTVATNPVGKLDDYATADLFVRRRIGPEGLAVALRATNLFDEGYVHPGVRDASAGLTPGYFDENDHWNGSAGFFSSVLPQPGRALSLVVEWER